MKKQLTKWAFTGSILLFLNPLNALFATETSLSHSFDTTWVNIVVPSNSTTLEELATTYYGNKEESKLIYESNKDIIPATMKLHEGMKLKMPVTEQYIDQPEHLGWR